MWIGRRFPSDPECNGGLTSSAVHDVVSQCFLLETLAVVGMDLREDDFAMIAPHCLKLTALRFERVVCFCSRNVWAAICAVYVLLRSINHWFVHSFRVGQHSLTSHALLDLLEKLLRLKKVSFEACRGITFKDIAAVVLSIVKRGGLSHLKKITMRDIRGYTLQRAKQLQQQLSERGQEVIVV